MKQLAWILLFALVPLAQTQAQVRVSGGVTVRFGHDGARIEPRVRIDIGRTRQHRAPRHTPAPRGHWQIVHERVWVPPVYEYRYGRCGERIRVCVRRGYWKTIERRVWVPACPPPPRCQH